MRDECLNRLSSCVTQKTHNVETINEYFINFDKTRTEARKENNVFPLI